MMINFNIAFLRYDFTSKNIFTRQWKSLILLVTILLSTFNYVHAEDRVEDKFRIAIGGYIVPGYESAVSLTDPDLGVGVSISPKDTLGLNTKQTVLRLDGQYHFNEEHSLTFSLYEISSVGNKVLETEIDWVDKNGNPVTIPIGASVNTNLDYDIYKVGYLWSFYNTDKVKMVAGAGLHITRIVMGLNSETTSSGVDATNASISVPLPVLSFGLTYKVTPRFSWHIKSEFFSIAFDDFEGIYIDNTMGLEYRVFNNIDLGVALANNSLKVSEKTSDYKFTFDNRISGVMIYVAASF
ncbi:MAG: hypothetical protein COB45_03255 [Gammaproteobacteria bacterium]|nr:MAG: hypothetical protein COB45_03255 [Gammaproteobacteria bacterium]PHR83877.1 MAG: hypothetical protein COA59_09525 [Colwellia sp.]